MLEDSARAGAGVRMCVCVCVCGASKFASRHGGRDIVAKPISDCPVHCSGLNWTGVGENGLLAMCCGSMMRAGEHCGGSETAAE
jgi:hypothetical protein